MLSHDDLVVPDFKQKAKGNFVACMGDYYLCNSQILDLMSHSNGCYKQFWISINTSLFYYTPQSQTQTLMAANYAQIYQLAIDRFEEYYEQWPSFRDLFTTVCINHSKFSPDTKLYHLRNKTRGEAGAIMKRYTLFHDQNRYENR